jgi:hypothetical protein
MSETFSGQVNIQNGSAQTTVQIDGDSGDVSVGGGGQGGEIRMKTSAGTQRLNLNGDPGTITFMKPAGMPTISLNGGTADISAGGGGEDGDLTLRSGTDDLRIRLDAGGGAQTTERIYLNGASAEVIVGGNVNAGSLKIKSSDAKDRIFLDGGNGNIWMGGNGSDGDLLLFEPSATSFDTPKAVIHLDAGGSAITVRDGNAKDRILLDGGNGNIWMGGNGSDGDLLLFAPSATSFDAATAVIHLDAGGSNIFVRSGDAKNRIQLDGGNGNIWLGGNGADGDLVIFPSSATKTGGTDEATIHLDGEAGDITLKNADCAEEFDITSEAEIEAGTVMVLDGEGALRESTEAYDKKVAGVLSGAGKYRPGIVLDRQDSSTNRRPLALVGKVYCKVDADCSPLEVGDLLTTSPTPGHAMKAADPVRAFGAVIGKALRPLKEGRGLIPILVALQ